MEGGCLGVEILAEEWPKSGRKTPQSWWGRGWPCGEKQEREMSFDVFDMFYLDKNEPNLLGYAFI